MMKRVHFKRDFELWPALGSIFQVKVFTVVEAIVCFNHAWHQGATGLWRTELSKATNMATSHLTEAYNGFTNSPELPEPPQAKNL